MFPVCCVLPFLAAQSRSRSLVVGPSVGPTVGHVCEKVTFRVSSELLSDGVTE